VRARAERPERLDHFLASVLPDVSRTKIAAAIQQGLVQVEGKPRKPAYKLRVGQEVEWPEILNTPRHHLEPVDLPLDVVFEDEWLLVVNKPRGLATHPAPSLREPTLVHALLARTRKLSNVGGDYRPGIVHRLDKPTTGLLLVAKTDLVHERLARQLQQRVAERRYFAVVHGWPERERFTIDAPIGRSAHVRTKMAIVAGGRQAVTHVKVIQSIASGTVVGVRLETGRTHQIRVHLSAVGHPIVGDALYGPKSGESLPLQLHAAFLRFEHPIDQRTITLFAAPPDDFEGRERCGVEQLDPWK
jgi:23S rRNA pseudouridine1911/1915/1917 synthase